MNRVPRIIIIKRKWVFKWRNDWKTATFLFIFAWFHCYHPRVLLVQFNLLCVSARRSFIYSKLQFHIHITKRNIEKLHTVNWSASRIKKWWFFFRFFSFRCEVSPAGTDTHITDSAAPFFFIPEIYLRISDVNCFEHLSSRSYILWSYESGKNTQIKRAKMILANKAREINDSPNKVREWISPWKKMAAGIWKVFDVRSSTIVHLLNRTMGIFWSEFLWLKMDERAYF